MNNNILKGILNWILLLSEVFYNHSPICKNPPIITDRSKSNSGVAFAYEGQNGNVSRYIQQFLSIFTAELRAIRDGLLYCLSQEIGNITIASNSLSCIQSITENNHSNLIVEEIIIYHDFLHPPRRGSHVKLDNAHTIIKHTLLSPYT